MITDAQKAAGFVDFGNGVVARWATTTESSSKCPSYASSCFSVTLQTNVTCSRGVYIELQLLDNSESVIGKANEITPAMYPGDKGIFPVSSETHAPKAKFARLDCLNS